ncbi:MAG: hypothetical protein WCY24_07825 [Lutispora sp.]|nr:hypothetical protein [Lutispora sp.]MDD4835092.1 hypothetical protein [Lutispora sp.]
MSFLKNLGDKALNTAKVVGNKSQDLMEISKLKLQISQVEGDIKKLKSEIGEVVYNAYANGLGSPSDQVVTLCDSITAKHAEIEEIKVKIQQVQND